MLPEIDSLNTRVRASVPALSKYSSAFKTINLLHRTESIRPRRTEETHHTLAGDKAVLSDGTNEYVLGKKSYQTGVLTDAF